MIILTFRGLAFLLFFIGLIVLLIISPRQGHAETLEASRTATWYANRPALMRRMHTACIDDPGHGRNLPDCINSHAGGWIEAERHARAAVAHPAPGKLSPFDQLPITMARRP